MITCPRCNLEQDESPSCEYCGLDFTTVESRTPNAGAHRARKLTALIFILVLCGTAITAYLFYYSGTGSTPKSPVVQNSGRRIQNSSDKGLHTAVKELSGDLGLTKKITGGYTSGSIIAMVVFSIIGLGYFSYGKKSRQLMMMICGIGLMGYSYFIDQTLAIVVVGLVLCALPFVFTGK